MNDLTEPTIPETSAAAASPRGVEHAGVIDALPWDGSDLRLFQLQEKMNAYLSFILDGEMVEAYPVLKGKPLRIQLDCATAPDTKTFQFLKMIRDQIAFQGIDLQVRAASMGSEVPNNGSCGEGCGCSA
jgi:hypothetical protein